MKNMQSVLTVFGLVAAAQAWGSGWNDTEPVVWTTVTTDVYTTFCPESTTFTHGTKTYTATASETITITDCPCTISKPVKSTPWVKPTTTPVAPPPPHHNATWVPPVWITTTETVKTYTTYCPAPTTVVQGNKTYTVTEATTLTITDCPCTQTTTYPGTVSTVTSYTTTYCPAPTTITIGISTYPVTVPGTVTIPIESVTTCPISSGTYVPPPVSTSVYVPSGTAPGASIITSATKTPKSPSATTSGPVQVTGNAGMKVEVGFGAVAAAGLAALLL